MLLRPLFPEFPATSMLMKGSGPKRGESHSHPDTYSDKSVRGGSSRRNYVVEQQRKNGDHGCKSDQSVDRNPLPQPFPVVRWTVLKWPRMFPCGPRLNRIFSSHIGHGWKTGIFLAERRIDHIATIIRIRGRSRPTIGLGDPVETNA